jgi:hypothetical protein
MATVTIDRETGEVVIRCSLEEAMAVEATLVSSRVPQYIEDRIHQVWDQLDDLRLKVLKKHPNDISLRLRELRG